MNSVTRASGWLLAAIGLSGCGASSGVNVPLGRSIAPGPPHAAATQAAPASAGDPPGEQGGTIPPAARRTEQTVSRAGLAQSPTQALRRYAIAYTNWQASRLAAREQLLAELATGPAKLTAEQTQAAGSATAALVASHVANAGRVLAIARAEGQAPGEWVVVTEEHTTGTGGYAGLPAGPHVTLAQVTLLPGRGWAVSTWSPAS
jgi:hypothetical protein